MGPQRCDQLTPNLLQELQCEQTGPFKSTHLSPLTAFAGMDYMGVNSAQAELTGSCPIF